MHKRNFKLQKLVKQGKNTFFTIPPLFLPTRYREVLREINRAPRILEDSFYAIFISVWNIKEKVTVTDVFYYSSIEDPLGLKSPKNVAGVKNKQEEEQKQAKITIQALYRPNSFVRIASSSIVRIFLTSFFVLFYLRSNKILANNSIQLGIQTDFSSLRSLQPNDKLDVRGEDLGLLRVSNLLEKRGEKTSSLINKINSESVLNKRVKNILSKQEILQNKEERVERKSINEWIYIPLGLGFENNETIFSYRNLGLCLPLPKMNSSYTDHQKTSPIFLKNLPNSTQFRTEISNHPQVLHNESIFYDRSLESPLTHGQDTLVKKLASVQFLFLPYILLRIWLAPFFVLWWSYKFDSEKKKEIKKNLKAIHRTEISSIHTFVEKAITFRDIGGMEALKKELSTVAYLLRKGENSNTHFSGYLFAGPPGTGKTLMAKAMSYEAETPYLYVEGSQFRCQEPSIAHARVDDLFKQINSISPCILYIDEIDSIGEKREEGNLRLEKLERIADSVEGKRVQTRHKPSETVLMQFLIYMDGYKARKDLVIIGATNRIDILDDAMMRPGRFDRQIIFSLPFMEERADILKIFLRNSKAEILDSTRLLMAERSMGLNGSDLRLLADNIILMSAFETLDHDFQSFTQSSIDNQNTRRSTEQLTLSQTQKVEKTLSLMSDKNSTAIAKITPLTFDKAFERVSKIRHTIVDYSITFSSDDFYRTAYHQVGKAIVQTLLPEYRSVYSISLFPRPLNERYLEIEKANLRVPSSDIIATNNLDYFVQKIVGLLAGRASETVLFESRPDLVSTSLNKTYDPNIDGAYQTARYLVHFGILNSLTGILPNSTSDTKNYEGIEPLFMRINNVVRKRILFKTNRELRKIAKYDLEKPYFHEFWYEQDYPWEFDFIQRNFPRIKDSDIDMDTEIGYVLHTLFDYTYQFLKSNRKLLDEMACMLLQKKSISQDEIQTILLNNNIKIPTKTWEAW
uniref:Cell division protein n=1 Tax=Chlorokybus atmophyticus TaxID=3144 RepID=Q19V85_CHLAT|nr:cell division protein [Chlorokybus atmophyticus]ABD62184.2 cell division protein [Chlorokybus atmophyticus]WKT05596.1 ATP-dependent metalloprotease [Chlorokybus atmophyticus]